MTPPPPEPSKVLPERLRYFRTKQDWTQAELAERMSSHGFAWDTSIVSKTENGDRKVTVDEYIGLAFVLGVPPIALLVPQGDASVRVTPSTTMHVTALWSWMTGGLVSGGMRPGQSVKVGTAEHEERARFYEEARPTHLVTAERRLPGLYRLARLAATAERALGIPQEHIPSAYASILETLDEVAATASGLKETLRREVRAASRARSEATK